MNYTVNSEAYYNNIRDKLGYLVTLVKMDNRVNVKFLNFFAEDFFEEFLNGLFDWQLKNANTYQRNMPGIDLLDEANKIIVQVSISYTYEKIQKSLEKSDRPEYHGYHFYFVAITENVRRFRPFYVPTGLTFDKDQDVLSIPVLLRHVQSAGLEKQKTLSELMDKHLGSEKKTPKGQCLTRMPEYTTTKEVIRREVELRDITERLRKGENMLLISGFGGVGKTALARLVFHEVKENYDEVAWIPYLGCLKDSMLAAIQGFEEVNDPEARWYAILNLKNNGKSKLFVIDNADRDEKTGQSPQDDRDLIALSGWPNTTVIVTSRLKKLVPYFSYPINFLSLDACMKLFYQYYPNDPEQKQKDTVEKLVMLAKYHPLTVELIAKGGRRKTDLYAYYTELKESFATAKLKVRVDHNDKSRTIVEHMRLLFDIASRTEEENAVLWDFAVLPADAALTSNEADQWFGHDINVLDQLAQDGWLSWTGGHYTMHPLVKEILHLDPIPEETAKEFLAFIEDEENQYFRADDAYTETDRKLELAESVVAEVCHEETVQLAYILHNMGRTYWRVGQFQKAKERFEHAIRIKEAKLGEDHPDTATTYNNIALVYQDMGDLPKALEFYEKAMAIREAKLGTAHPNTATTYNNIARVYQDMGDLPKTLTFYEKAMAIHEAKLGTAHPNTATTYNNIARVYQDMGDLPKAIAFYEKAMAIREAKLGEDHPSTADTYNNIANIYRTMGDLSKALTFYEKAMAIREAKLGEDNLSTVATYNNIAGNYRDMGNFDQALKYYEKALKICEEKLGEDHPDIAAIYDNIAGVYYAKGDDADVDKALECYKKALLIYEAKLGEDHLDTATTYNYIATVYHAKRDFDEALVFYKKALAIREAKLKKSHPLITDNRISIAETYGKKGALQKALECYWEIDESAAENRRKKYQHIAAVQLMLGKYEEAVEYSKCAQKASGRIEDQVYVCIYSILSNSADAEQTAKEFMKETKGNDYARKTIKHMLQLLQNRRNER